MSANFDKKQSIFLYIVVKPASQANKPIKQLTPADKENILKLSVEV